MHILRRNDEELPSHPSHPSFISLHPFTFSSSSVAHLPLPLLIHRFLHLRTSSILASSPHTSFLPSNSSIFRFFPTFSQNFPPPPSSRESPAVFLFVVRRLSSIGLPPGAFCRCSSLFCCLASSLPLPPSLPSHSSVLPLSLRLLPWSFFIFIPPAMPLIILLLLPSLLFPPSSSSSSPSVHHFRRWENDEDGEPPGANDHHPPCNSITSEAMIKHLLQNYSRSVSPSRPVPVQVETTIQDINELSVMSNSFTADLWFSAIWHDPRLAFAHLDPCRRNLSFDDTFEKMMARQAEKIPHYFSFSGDSTPETVLRDSVRCAKCWAEFVAYLWSPNVCLVNTKHNEVHMSPKPNVLLMLLSNGTVWLNYRVRVEAPCMFRLSDFPMDTALCSLVFESYSFNTVTVRIDWLPQAAVTLKTTEFSASDYELTHTKHYKHTEHYKAGAWYRLTVEIGFKRRYGYYILQVYANMYISVFLSWIAFCISLKALPARVILSVNTLMSLCLQFGNVVNSLPPVSYIKSIDYFMFVCIAFIFASLLEMAFIAYKDKKMVLRSLRVSLGIGSLFDLAGISAAAMRQEEEEEDEEGMNGRRRSRRGRGGSARSRGRMRRSEIGGDGDGTESMISDGFQGDMLLVSDWLAEEDDMPRVQDCIVHNMLKRRRCSFLARGHRIDQLSFMLFPMAFSLFNFVYWTYYLTKSYDEDDDDG